MISRRLPTVFGESIDQAIEAISTVQPDVVIALGQAGGRTGIGLERVALNIDDAAIADNNGNQPCDAPIMEGAPAAYFATLPIKVLVEEVQKAGIPAATSNSAGTLCVTIPCMESCTISMKADCPSGQGSSIFLSAGASVVQEGGSFHESS